MKIAIAVCFAIAACSSAPEPKPVVYTTEGVWAKEVRRQLINCWKTEDPDQCAIKKGIAI